MNQLEFRLKDIPEEGRDLHVPFAPDVLKEALERTDADPARSRVTAEFRLDRFGETVNVRGRLAGELHLPCLRCLVDTAVRLDVPLRVVIGPQSMGGEDSLEQEVEYFTHDGETVHLGDVLREALILALPMTVLCREECRGLCPVCGGDKNVKDCGHTQSFPDPRFAALKDLKL